MGVRKPREADVVRACLDYLRLAGVPAWRQNTGAARYGKRLVRFGPAGTADILGLVPPGGRFLAAECKAAAGRPTAAQLAFLGAVRDAGGLALCVRSAGELRDALRAEGYDVP